MSHSILCVQPSGLFLKAVYQECDSCHQIEKAEDFVLLYCDT